MQREHLPDRLGAGVRFEPGGQAQPERQPAVFLQRGVQLQGVTVRVHDVPAGQAGRRHVLQQRGEPVAAAGEGLGRDDRADQADRAPFEQVPGGPSVVVADDRRAGAELAWAVYAGQPQGRPAHQDRVRVEQVQAGGPSAQLPVLLTVLDGQPVHRVPGI